MNNDEELKKIIGEVMNAYDPFWAEPVLGIIKKIKDLPNNSTFTVGELIDPEYRNTFNGYEKGQQSIYNLVIDVCEKLNIIIEKNEENQNNNAFTLPLKIIKNDNYNNNIDNIKTDMVKNDDNLHSEVPESNNKEYIITKKDSSSKIYWIENPYMKGEHLFSFDKKTIFNLFRDYPHALTPEQKEIFDEEEPYWADFFKED